ncbi:hypothetical protein SLEP1_g41717 [Rubroshorea leprosula]|uniref:Uncharacterized protein n=1 Tax=Rubroshorea leprosula TaxID=152421 RepID=A0AAV5L7R3_9ROSI|nr:hypothetical protein SLEP1_g41717 [Rubroshorea leprosula]
MTNRVFSSTKPTNTVAVTMNGAGTTTATTNGGPTKSNLYNPTFPASLPPSSLQPPPPLSLPAQPLLSLLLLVHSDSPHPCPPRFHRRHSPLRDVPTTSSFLLHPGGVVNDRR